MMFRSVVFGPPAYADRAAEFRRSYNQGVGTGVRSEGGVGAAGPPACRSGWTPSL